MPVLNQTSHNTRSPNQFIPFRQKSQYFSKTFFPYTTNLYNKLEPHLRKNHDMLDFKSKLKEKYKDKLSNSFHTQLRLGPSFLAAQGYDIGLNDSDLCLCWGPETRKHYFLDCFLFSRRKIQTIL